MAKLGELIRSLRKPKVKITEQKDHAQKVPWIDAGTHVTIKVKIEPTTPAGWIERFEKVGNRVSVWMKEILRNESIVFETPHSEIEFILVKGLLFSNKDRTCEYVADYGKKSGYSEPSIYESCLLAEAIDPEMLNALKLEWVMLMSGTIITENGKEKLPIVQLNNNIKVSEDKIVLTLHNFRPETKQNASGLYAFVANSKHGSK